MIGARDGRQVRGARVGPASDPAALGAALADKLLVGGGWALLGAR
jgi:hypothetical protein